VSRSKRARAKERKLSAATRAPESAPAEAPRETESSRIAPARRRANTAKIGIGAAAVISVGASMGLARVTYEGHTKRPVQTLSIPQPLYVVVRKNLLQAGIMAPATAPPDVTTSTS